MPEFRDILEYYQISDKQLEVAFMRGVVPLALLHGAKLHLPIRFTIHDELVNGPVNLIICNGE